MKKKIVIPSEEDVARFGGGPKPTEKPNAPEGLPTGEPTPPPAGETPPESAPAAADQAASPETLNAEAEQWKDKFLRAKADLLNYQRRAEKDRAESLRYANAGLVQALLPVLDDLERVVAAAAKHKNDPETFVAGVRLTLENCLKTLKSFGVEPIEAAGKPFDPTHHEAIMQQPSDEHPVPTVLSEVLKGYCLHDRVLRPSRVIVSKPAEPPTTAGNSEEREPSQEEQPSGGKEPEE
ncbi:MAG: nucleotide exchange factor GrpE [Phycisphaerae bacterium]